MRLSDVAGGGASQIIDLFSTTLQVAAGVTGNIITITPPAGKRAILAGLCLISSSGGTETGISVLRGATTVVNNKALANNTDAANTFAVLGTKQVSTTAGTTGYIQQIAGKINEPIVVNKTGGNTAAIIVYSYAFGD